MTVLNDSPDASEDLDGAADRRRQVLIELKSARAESLDVLERSAAPPDLQRAAGRLGQALRTTADDVELWETVATSSSNLKALSATQLADLERLRQVDWDVLLDQLEYQGPPPSEVIGRDLAVAVNEAVRSGSGADVATTVEKVRRLADTLLGLADAAEPDGRALRRWLRRGVRAAGKLTLILGLGTVKVMGAAAVAAWAAPAVMAIGVPVAVGAVVIDLIFDGVMAGMAARLNRAWDRILPPEDEPGAGTESDPADLESSDAIKVDWADLGRLKNDLDLLAAVGLSSEGLTEVVDRTALRADRLAAALVHCWDAALGASWATPVFYSMTQAISDDLRSIRTGLDVFKNGHGPFLSVAGSDLVGDVQALTDFFREHVGYSHDGC